MGIHFIDVKESVLNQYTDCIIEHHMSKWLQGLPVDNVLLSDDYDGDGLTLDKEYEYDTNPFLADTDEDGLDDYEEINIYNTIRITGIDGDLMSDGTEYPVD